MITAVGAAAQVVAAAPPSNTEKQYAGETAIQITNAMKQALDALADLIRDVETKGRDGVPGIAPALNAAGDLVSANRAFLVANRPALANGRGGNMTGADQMGEAS